MTISNNSMPIPTTLVPQTQGLPSFIQMEQAKAVVAAVIQANTGSSDPNAMQKGDDFKSLMPTWMLDMANAYSNTEKLNSATGAVGKFLAKVATLSTLQNAFSTLVSAAGSFGALKDFFAKDSSQWNQAGGGVSSLATAMEETFKNWKPASKQVQEQESAEYGIMSQQSQGLQAQSQSSQVATTEIQKNGNGIINDAGNLAQMIGQLMGSLVN